jgi:rhodanese-related sulfurtransferase/DNA-binding transcriptional ArsR family regulator
MKKAELPELDHLKFKVEVYSEVARVGAALANPKRLWLLELLAQRARSVEDLAVEMGISVASASQHLRALADARLVSTDRRGTYAFYSLANESVYRLVASVRDVAEERLSEVPAIVKRHLGDLRTETDVVPTESLDFGTKTKDWMLLDVRPSEEYQSAHIAGAESLPIEQLLRKVHKGQIPTDREIIVYCRGPFCVWADEAVALLRKRGYRARRLRLGVRDYEALGVDIERNS